MTLSTTIARLSADLPDRPLDKAWNNVNALGAPHPQTEYERGYCEAIDHALAEIEKLGGTDPAIRRLEDALDA